MIFKHQETGLKSFIDTTSAKALIAARKNQFNLEQDHLTFGAAVAVGLTFGFFCLLFGKAA